MPKQSRTKRWEHSSYKNAYCIERYGNVYTTICGENAKVIKGLKWETKNKATALRILGERYVEYMKCRSGESIAIKKDMMISEAYIEYIKVMFPNLTPNVQKRVHIAMKQYLPVNLPLANIKEIRDLIIEQKAEYNHKSAYLKKQLSILKRFFDYCIEQDYLVKNPVNRYMFPAIESNEVLMFSREEVNLMVDFLQSNSKIAIPLYGKTYYRSRSERESSAQYAQVIEFISYIGTRAEETLKIFWDEEAAPLIKGDKDFRKSIISDNHIIIDGKRSNYRVPVIREFPLELVPESYNILEKCKKFKEENNGKLFKYNSYASIERTIRNIVMELKLPNNRNLHSLRKTAINHWENELGINPYICAYMAGHSEDIRRKHYRVKPGAEELVKMHKNYSGKES